MLTDSHCHLASHKFSKEEIPALLSRAEENRVHRMVTLSTCLDDISANLELASQYPQIHATVGIHPCDVHVTSDDYFLKLRDFVSHPRCCAIGETGLDYFHAAPEGWTEGDYHTRQRDFLHQHFQLAAEVGKNIVIHTRDKTGDASLHDAVRIYQDYYSKVSAVFHCFLGPWENPHVKTILEMGGYLSYTGIATFKSAGETLHVAVNTPEDRIMVETDSPYLAPVPYRGKRNEPAYTLHTASLIAEAREMSLEQFSAVTEKNVEKFYKL